MRRGAPIAALATLAAPDQAVEIPAGDARDSYGNRNGNRLAVVG